MGIRRSLLALLALAPVTVTAVSMSRPAYADPQQNTKTYLYDSSKFYLQSRATSISLKSLQNGLFVTEEERISNHPLRANRRAIGPWEKFRIVSAGGNPTHFAFQSVHNGLYVAEEEGISTHPLHANRRTIGPWEKFTITGNTPVLSCGTTITIRSVQNGLYVTQENNLPDHPLRANRPSVGSWERFQVYCN